MTHVRASEEPRFWQLNFNFNGPDGPEKISIEAAHEHAAASSARPTLCPHPLPRLIHDDGRPLARAGARAAAGRRRCDGPVRRGAALDAAQIRVRPVRAPRARARARLCVSAPPPCSARAEQQLEQERAA